MSEILNIKEIMTKLSEPISKEAIQRTNKADTKKGYDTTGYGYQYCIDRFNDVCGANWGYNWEILKEIQGNYKSGAPFWSITVSLGIWVSDKLTLRLCVGSHTATDYGDALKGAITNAFKKTASFWGVGREAYAGTIDDDNQPYPDTPDNKDNETPDKQRKEVISIYNLKILPLIKGKDGTIAESPELKKLLSEYGHTKFSECTIEQAREIARIMNKEVK